jgi:hypothetical protein
MNWQAIHMLDHADQANHCARDDISDASMTHSSSFCVRERPKKR